MMDPTNTPVRHDVRRTLQTPRFIFESSNPSGSGSTPRFAATPRFLLGEERRRDPALGDDIDTSDVELPSTMDHPVPARSHKKAESGAARDEIPDSEDDEELSQEESHATLFEGRIDRDDDMEIRDIEDEYDILFPTSPTQPGTKRRRLSPSPTRARETRRSGVTETDRILSSPESGSSRLLQRPDPASQLTGDTLPSPARPPPSTPFPGTAAQFHPPSSRVVLNAHSPSTLKQPNIAASEPSENATSATTPIRRPQFILPLTPSRCGENELSAAPTRSDPPFSPIATRNGRPGRPRRSAGADFIAGGMAAEVRNWIFELNAQRQASQYPASQYPQKQTPTQVGLESTQQHQSHYLVSEIQDVTTSLSSVSGRNVGSKGSSGTAATTLIIPSDQHPQRASSSQRILLLAYPLSSPAELSRRDGDAAALLKRGDRIGIRKGVVWGMDIRTTTADSGVEGASADRTPGIKLEKWLVGTEWDILPKPTI